MGHGNIKKRLVEELFFSLSFDTTCKTMSSSQKCVKQHAIIIKMWWQTSLRRVVSVLIWFLYSSSRWLAFKIFNYFNYLRNSLNMSISFGKFILKFFFFILDLNKIKKPRIYLFFWNFQGFQVVAYDTEFFFKFNNFTVKKRDENIKNLDIVGWNSRIHFLHQA